MTAADIPPHVRRFLTQEIDSVPALEALLLLWDSRDRSWPVAELAARVYLPEPAMHEILRDMQRRRIIDAGESGYRYVSGAAEADAIMADVATTYRLHLIPVSMLLHVKASASVREFARAFDLKDR